MVALQEARRRIGEHGLFVVADVANLPFPSDPFEGIVSLHTLHHLPLDDQANAYKELFRVLRPGSAAVVVNGWTDSSLMRRMGWLVRGMEHVAALAGRLKRRRPEATVPSTGGVEGAPARNAGTRLPTGTFINKLDAGWLRENIGASMHYELYPWRSVSVRFLRAVIHEITGGRVWLGLLFWLEERFPRFFAEQGQYPMVIIRK
jgi:SAM-dependent methyltransferase